MVEKGTTGGARVGKGTRASTAALGGSAFQGPRDGAQIKEKRGEPAFDDVPDSERVHLTVIVDQLVAHAGDLAPRHFRMGEPNLLRHSFSGFAQNLQVADDGVAR